MTISIFFFLFICLLSASTPSMSTVHNIGDAAGWTIATVNYAAWAASRIFRVGDTIVFSYNKNLHDMLVVRKLEFGACSMRSPLGVYDTGNGVIDLRSPGPRYFICGVPGHCQVGMKVEIDVRAPVGVNSSSSAIRE